MQPYYLELFANGELERRANTARDRLTCCTLCPWRCRIDRTAGKRGVCRTGLTARATLALPGAGDAEQRPGKIYFSHCNLNCVYCRTVEKSHTANGLDLDEFGLAQQFLAIQASGCARIVLISPGPSLAVILGALVIAVQGGLRLPLAYASAAYESLDSLALLDGVIDLYLPDMKYAESGPAHQLSGVRDYARISREAILEMARQVGALVVDDSGRPVRGLLVRHTLLPGHSNEATAVAHWLAGQISSGTALSLALDYQPAHKAHVFPQLNRQISSREAETALRAAKDAGLQVFTY